MTVMTDGRFDGLLAIRRDEGTNEDLGWPRTESPLWPSPRP